MGPGEAMPRLCAYVLRASPRIRVPPCSPHAQALIAHCPPSPLCRFAMLTLCACGFRRGAIWCKRTCKVAGWESGMTLERAGMGRAVG